MEVKDAQTLLEAKINEGEWKYHHTKARRRLEKIVGQDIASHAIQLERPVRRARHICSWKFKDSHGQMHVCNNRCIRAPGTGDLLFHCGWHCEVCCEEHAGKLAPIDTVNVDGLCSMHFIAKNGSPPDEIEDPLKVKGVVLGIEVSSKHPLRPKAERDRDPYQVSAGYHRKTDEEPSLAELDLEPDIFDRIGGMITRGMVQTGVLSGNVFRGVTAVQATYRMLVQRRAYLRFRRMQDSKKRDEAARMLQRIYRGKRVIEAVRALRLARQIAARITQRAWRYARWQRTAKVQYRQKRAATKIQRWARRRWLMLTFVTMRQRLKARITGLAETRSRLMVANVLLGWLARYRYRKLRLRATRQKMAARVIQKSVRVWIGLRLQIEVRADLVMKKALLTAASRVQKWWRRYIRSKLATSVIWKYRKNVVRIQAACRGHLARQQCKRLRRRIGSTWRWLDSKLSVGFIRKEVGLLYRPVPALAGYRHAHVQISQHQLGSSESDSQQKKQGLTAMQHRGVLLSTQDEIEVAIVDLYATLLIAEVANTGLLHPTAFRRALQQCGIPAKRARRLQAKYHETRTDRTNWHRLVQVLFDDERRDKSLVRLLVDEARVAGRLNTQRDRFVPDVGSCLRSVVESTSDGTLPVPEGWAAKRVAGKPSSMQTMNDPIEETEAVVHAPGVGLLRLETVVPEALDFATSRRDRLDALRQRTRAMGHLLAISSKNSIVESKATTRRVEGALLGDSEWKHDEKGYNRIVHAADALSQSIGGALDSGDNNSALDAYGGAMLGLLDDKSRAKAETELRGTRRSIHSRSTKSTWPTQSQTQTLDQFSAQLTKRTNDAMAILRYSRKDMSAKYQPRSDGIVTVLGGECTVIRERGSLLSAIVLDLNQRDHPDLFSSSPDSVVQMLVSYNAFFERHWQEVVSVLRSGCIPASMAMPDALRAKVAAQIEPRPEAADRLETVLRSFGFIQRSSLRRTKAAMSYAGVRQDPTPKSAIDLLMPKTLPKLKAYQRIPSSPVRQKPQQQLAGIACLARSNLNNILDNASQLESPTGASPSHANKAQSQVSILAPGMSLEKLHSKSSGLGASAAQAERYARGIASGQIVHKGEAFNGTFLQPTSKSALSNEEKLRIAHGTFAGVQLHTDQVRKRLSWQERFPWLQAEQLGTNFRTPPFKPDRRITLPACSKHQWMFPGIDCASCKAYRMLPLPQPPVSFFPGLRMQDLRSAAAGGGGLHLCVASSMLSMELSDSRAPFGRMAYRTQLWRCMRDAVIVKQAVDDPPAVIAVLALCLDKNGDLWICGQRLWFYSDLAGTHRDWPATAGLQPEACVIGKKVLYVKVKGDNVVGQAICLNETPKYRRESLDPPPLWGDVVAQSGLPKQNCFRFASQLPAEVEEELLQKVF